MCLVLLRGVGSPGARVLHYLINGLSVLVSLLTVTSCLINAHFLPPHHTAADDYEMGGIGCCQVVLWMRSFIKPDLFNNVPFDNITPIYLLNCSGF